MKKLSSYQTIKLLLFLLIPLLTSSCGTIIGGAKYNARVEVKGHNDAKIYVDGNQVGIGQASFLHKRNNANKLAITLKKEGCIDYTHNYDSKVARLGPVLGSVYEGAVMISSIGSGVIVIPGGTIIDMLTGGYYKPNAKHPDITKIDYDNFKYTIDYPNCDDKLKNSIK